MVRAGPLGSARGKEKWGTGPVERDGGPCPLRMAREGILSRSQRKWCHPRTMLPCQRDSVSLRLPPQPRAWPRPHRTRRRRRQSAPLRRRKAGAEAAAGASRGNLAHSITAHTLPSASAGHGTPKGAAQEPLRGRQYLSARLGRCLAASRSRSGIRRCALTPPLRAPRNLSPRKGAEF